jgi:ubiquinone/menaquinone biosynthesis C-methylase UbiE
MSEKQDKSDFSLETLSEAVNYNRFVVDRMRPYLGKKVLELGTGIGNLTPLFLEDGREVKAIDIEKSLIAVHRKRVPASPKMKVECISLQDLARKSKEQSSYESVVSSNVLEHIPDGTIGEVVSSMHTVLKPGGHAVHWVPAFNGIFGSMDESFGHYRRYSKETAARLFQVPAYAGAGLALPTCRALRQAGAGAQAKGGAGRFLFLLEHDRVFWMVVYRARVAQKSYSANLGPGF